MDTVDDRTQREAVAKYIMVEQQLNEKKGGLQFFERGQLVKKGPAYHLRSDAATNNT